MGQQQPLLLVLATIIVGLSVAAGIEAFDRRSTVANQDALTNQAVAIANDIQAEVRRPVQLAGVDASSIDDLDVGDRGLQIGDLGYPAEEGDILDGEVYVTVDGECQLSSAVEGSDVGVRCESEENEVEVVVTDFGADGIETIKAQLKEEE